MKPTIAVVVWEDASMGGHWHDGTLPGKDDALHVYSVGWLIHDDPDRIVMVQSITEGSHGNTLTIPRGMVRKPSEGGFVMLKLDNHPPTVKFEIQVGS